ncbi:hypothetical protein Nepgr_020725 [Nepenthes gracilis]|uniref:Uncharacterized protein n=1 Tax=Nepenthes gracilis TaxID=150966 RepID=A0AAD3XWD0_NEPGR|nr:hypothetical protein Nepgr_020725 [Nepenthes gracilis]
MAKDIAGVPVPDEITKIDNLRRNSTAKPSSATKEDNSSPHYLRASTGSCHDSCKYGKQHMFVVKAWRPLRRRNPTPPLQDDRNPVEILLLTGKKSTQPVKDAYKLESSPTMEYPPTNKSPSSNVSESIEHDAPLHTKSPSVDASKSINEDYPSLFYDASSMESLLPKKSPLPDASKSIKHDARSPAESPLVDTSKSINEDFPCLFSEVSFVESLLPMKSPSQNVSTSIKHDALSPTKSLSVEASKSINDDYPSIFSDASAVKSPFPMTSTHNTSKSTEHEAPSPTKSPLVEVSKSISKEFLLHSKSPFPDVLELTNQEVLTATASHDASESINRVISLHIPEETVSPTKCPSADASKSLDREVSSTIKPGFAMPQSLEPSKNFHHLPIKKSPQNGHLLMQKC